MNIENIHKYITITPTATGSSVTIAGQQAIVINKYAAMTEGSNESYSWSINPTFARMAYNASSYADVPYCHKSHETEHLAIAEAIVTMMELGAFKTAVELPEDTYSATMVQEATEATESEIKQLVASVSSNLFERVAARGRIADPQPLSEARIGEIKTAISEDRVGSHEKFDMYISIMSGQVDFIGENNLPLTSKLIREEIVIEEVAEVSESSPETEEVPASVSLLKEYQSRRVALDESLRLVSTHTSKDGKKVAKLYKDAEWSEHRVKHFVDGKHQTEADYHTDDKAEAADHAKSWVGEARESEYSANTQLAAAKPEVKKVRIIGPSKGTVSKHDNIAQAKAHFKNKGYSSSKGYSIQEELEDGTFADVIFEDVDTAHYEKWMTDVKKKHGDKKLSFRSRVERGVHTTSAEVPGKDRSYAVYDHDKGTGHIFEEEQEIQFDPDTSITEGFEESETPQKDVFKFVGKYSPENGFKVKE
jgi:hypothetical protein